MSLNHQLNESVMRNWIKVAEEYIEQNNRAKGWYDDERTFGDEVALLHSEVSEMLDAFRDYRFSDPTVEGGKPEGVGSEMADVLVRLLDMTKRHGIDLAAEFVRKMKYNESRPYRHGNRAL